VLSVDADGMLATTTLVHCCYVITVTHSAL
jgi:hypothetical protein